MASPTAFVHRTYIGTLSNEQGESLECPAVSRRAIRGAVTGMLLGASLWAIILIAFRVIKL
jgi:hypothetical protein